MKWWCNHREMKNGKIDYCSYRTWWGREEKNVPCPLWVNIFETHGGQAVDQLRTQEARKEKNNNFWPFLPPPSSLPPHILPLSASLQFPLDIIALALSFWTVIPSVITWFSFKFHMDNKRKNNQLYSFISCAIDRLCFVRKSAFIVRDSQRLNMKLCFSSADDDLMS